MFFKYYTYSGTCFINNVTYTSFQISKIDLYSHGGEIEKSYLSENEKQSKQEATVWKQKGLGKEPSGTFHAVMRERRTRAIPRLPRIRGSI